MIYLPQKFQDGHHLNRPRQAAAAQGATAHDTLFLNAWSPFTAASRHLTGYPASLWSDGVHLTELGDTVLLQQTERLLAEHRIVEGSWTTRSWSATVR